MWVRLTRKLADFLDGVDVSDRRVGEVFELPTVEAHLLVAERWAEPHVPPVAQGGFRRGMPSEGALTREAHSVAKRLRQVREQLDRRRFAEHARRRIEDRIRDELRESRMVTIRAGRQVS
jgi:hypothetical protein